MSGADLSGAVLEGNVFTLANLDGARLRGAQLRRADFSNARLKNADLTRAQLNGSILRDADLRGATLTAADFSGADLGDARFEDAVVGRIDWFDWLSRLATPPVRIVEIATAWRVVQDQSDSGGTRFVIRAVSSLSESRSTSR